MSISPEIIREISRIVLDSSFSDQRVNIYAGLSKAILLHERAGLHFRDIIEGIHKKFGIPKISKILLKRSLDSMVNNNLMMVVNERYRLLNPELIERKIWYDKLISIVNARVKEIIPSLDDYQSNIVSKVVDAYLITIAQTSGYSIAYSYGKKDGIPEFDRGSLERNIKILTGKYTDAEIEAIEKIIKTTKSAFIDIIRDNQSVQGILGLAGMIFTYRRLLCIDPNLSYIQKGLFKKCSVIFDTNILISAASIGSLYNTRIEWMIEELKNLEIKIFISDLTLEEFRRTIKKDDLYYRVFKSSGENLDFASRDIAVGYQKYFISKMNWDGYMEYLINFPGNFVQENNINVIPFSLIKIDQDKLDKLFSLLNKYIKSEKKKDYKTLLHDAILIEGSDISLRKMIEEEFSPIIVTRDNSLIKASYDIEYNNLGYSIPIISYRGLLETLIPFISIGAEIGEEIKILGKMLAQEIFPLNVSDMESALNFSLKLAGMEEIDEKLIKSIIIEVIDRTFASCNCGMIGIPSL